MTIIISSFVAFVTSDADVATLKSFAAGKGFGGDCIHQGTISDASHYLREAPAPDVLLVELPSQEEAPALLEALAEVCSPDTVVITVGRINEYSFYCWLMDIGIEQYLLCPLTEEALEGVFQKLLSTPDNNKLERPPAKIIAVMGTRGGVGATTVAINLAGILGEMTHKRVALVDLDPQEGSVALALDIQPSQNVRDALERPDRIDSLFLERVMNKLGKYLSILGAEENIGAPLNITEQAVEPLFHELGMKYDYVILDVPRHMTQFTRSCLQKADHALLVTELSLLSLRDTIRMQDAMREEWKIKPPMVIANRVGLAPKQEVPVADFEKGAKTKIIEQLPFAPDIFMPLTQDIAAIHYKAQPATRPLYRLAAIIAPEIKPEDGKEKKAGSIFSFLSKKGENDE